MAFQGLGSDVLDLLRPLAQKLLGGSGNRDIVALDLDLSHAVHLDGHPFTGVNLRRLHIDGQQLE